MKKIKTKKSKPLQWVILISAIALLLIGIGITFFAFLSNVRLEVSDQLFTYLSAAAEQNAAAASARLANDLEAITGLADTLSGENIESDDSIIKRLSAYNSSNRFARMGIIDPTGKAKTTDGAEIDLSKRAYLKDALNGKASISTTLESVVKGNSINVFAAPVYDNNGEVKKVLFASYDTAEYEKSLSLSWFYQSGQTFLIQSDGMLLINPSNSFKSNLLLELADKYYFSSESAVSSLSTEILEGKSGYLPYKTDESGKEGGYIIYSPLSINNWYCVSLIPDDAVSARLSEIKNHGNLMAAIMFLQILGLLAILTIFSYRNYKQLKKSAESIAVTEERYRIVTEQSSSVIFDYNLNDLSIFFANVFEKKFGYTLAKGSFPQSALEAHMLHDEDEWLLTDAIEKCKSGRPYTELELRMRVNNGSFIWCLFRMTTLFDSKGKAYRIIGKIIDIDYTKRKTAMLTERSSKDSLTGFYNKSTAKDLISSALGEKGGSVISGMLLVDIDSFKLINDKLGHLIGDRCIVKIAETISQVFSSDEIIARVGGDEFIIFIKEVSGEDEISEIGSRLCAALSKCCVEDANHAPHYVTASVGFTVSTLATMASYEGLFRQADMAMYYSKKQGKNQCSKFTPDKEILLYNDEPPVISDEDFGLCVMNALSSGDSFANSVDCLLAIVGQRLNLSRTYIVEENEDRESYRIAFEWTAPGIFPTKCLNQRVPLSLVEIYAKNYDQNHLLYFSDSRKIDGALRQLFEARKVVSGLTVGLFRNNHQTACFAAEDCVSSRVWSSGEIAMLTTVAGIVDNLIVKRQKVISIKESEEKIWE